MAMETNTAGMPTNIRPVERPRGGSPSSGIQRRSDGASMPFAPRTDVNLRSSVLDMAGVLAKVASEQESSMEKLSPQLQKLIDSIMKQSFSLESTLAEGLGTTLESQRFAIDQLLTLSRMLSQMGTLAEQGLSAGIGDQLQALLTNLKAFLTAREGAEIEPTMLHKLAFQSLDEADAEVLPAHLQYLLTQQGGAGQAAMQPPGSESLGFLKQLMQYFMPAPPSESLTQDAAPSGAGREALPQDAQAQAEESAPAPGRTDAPPAQTRSEDGQPAQTRQGAETQTDEARETPREAAAQTQRPEAGADGARPRAQSGAAQETPQARTAQEKASARQGERPEAQEDGAARQTAQTQRPKAGADGARARAQSGAAQEAAQEKASARQSERPEAQEGGAARQTAQGARMAAMENTPRTMTAMKSLASLLLRDASLSPQDEKLLSDFANGKQTALTEKEARELQLLLRLCEKNIPASVQQSARQKGMEEMPRLWAFMELCDLALLKERSARQLKKTGRSLSEFASMMKHSIAPDNARTAEGQRSMSFMTQLYMADDMEKPYPAYIHVYDEEKKDETSGQMKKETWLRVCLLTEYIGAVDVSFRMYEDSNVDVRIYFSDRDNIGAFREYIDEFRASFADKPLTLKSVKLGVAGARS